MNEKTAKASRRLARLKTIGKPMVSYYVDVNKVRVSADSTRGVYLQIKRMLK